MFLIYNYLDNKTNFISECHLTTAVVVTVLKVTLSIMNAALLVKVRGYRHFLKVVCIFEHGSG